MFGHASPLSVDSLNALADQGGVPKVCVPFSKCVGASFVEVAVLAGITKSKGNPVGVVMSRCRTFPCSHLVTPLPSESVCRFAHDHCIFVDSENPVVLLTCVCRRVSSADHRRWCVLER